MKLVLNRLDEPRVLYDFKKLQLKPLKDGIKKDDVFFAPKRGEHEAYLKNYCSVYSENRPWNSSIGSMHGFMIEPTSASYTR